MNIVLAALLASAAVQSGSAAPQAGYKLVPVPARIEVTGYGEVKYMPDIATITYTVRGEGKTSDDAVRAMTATAARIEAAVAALDPAAEPRTSKVEVEPVRESECKDRRYGQPQLSTGACAIQGYVASQSITLHTSAVKDSGTMVGAIGRAGGTNPRIQNFTVRDSRPQQQQAMAAALEDARSKAAAMAAATDVRLGPILDIHSGRRNDAQQLEVRGSRTQPVPPPPPPAPVPVKLTPELLTTNAYVSVIYRIAE